MKVIGITGGIASGKTFLLKKVAKLGYKTFSSDEAAKQTRDVLGLTKEYVSSILFNKNESCLTKRSLEKLIQKGIKSKREKFILQNRRLYKKHIRKTQKIFCEVPLLFECNLQREFSHIISIYTPIFIRKRRSLKRGISKETFYQIIKKQKTSSRNLLILKQKFKMFMYNL